MNLSWISLYPEWYRRERQLLARHYPQLRVNEKRLLGGKLIFCGELIIRPPGGTKHHPIIMLYPEGTPFEHPVVIPIVSLPQWTSNGDCDGEVEPKLFDHRHQMPDGNLCLFQRETRGIPGGDILTGVDILRRAEKWFLGHHTSRQ